MRAAGLTEKLAAAGFEVTDRGDSEPFRWRPDPGSPRAQNLPRSAPRRLTPRPGWSRRSRAGELALVLGGDCTIELGTVAGLGALGRPHRPRLLRLPSRPQRARRDHAGALDWMGSAHMLGVEGAEPELVRLNGHAPLLRPDEILYFAFGPDQATPVRARAARAALTRRRVPVEQVRERPGRRGRAGAGRVRPGLRPPARALRRGHDRLHRRPAVREPRPQRGTAVGDGDDGPARAGRRRRPGGADHHRAEPAARRRGRQHGGAVRGRARGMSVGEALHPPADERGRGRACSSAALERGGLDAVAEYWHGPGRAASRAAASTRRPRRQSQRWARRASDGRRAVRVEALHRLARPRPAPSRARPRSTRSARGRGRRRSSRRW